MDVSAYIWHAKEMLRLRSPRWLTMASTSAYSSPLAQYLSLLDSGSIVSCPAQHSAAKKLDTIAKATAAGRGSRGLYFYSPPGRGKTMIADLYTSPQVTRLHFTDFMSDVHAALFQMNDSSANNMTMSQQERYDLVAKNLIKTPVLFLDELEVVDIADASILTRLLAAIAENGTTLVITR